MRLEQADKGNSMLHTSTQPLLWRLALASMVVAALAGGTSVLARQNDPPATDDRPGFRSIAEQELALADDPLAWQASELPAFLDEERPIPFYAGFLYANDAPLLIYRDGAALFTPLGADKAMPVESGDLLAPVSLRDDATTFLALELVAEDDALEPVGDPFLPDADDYVLELLRAEFEGTQDEGAREDEDEPVRLEATELPVLLVVVAGEVELHVEDEDPEELKAGDVLTVDEDFALRWLGEEPSVVLAARLRPPEVGDGLEGDGENGREDDADGSPLARTPAAGAREGGSVLSGSGGESGDDESDPTPTPKPTEEPGSDPVGDLPGAPPPTDDPPGGSGGGSGGSGSGGGGRYEEGPSDGECLYCAPSDGGLLESGPSGDPCLLADGGGDPDFDELNNCGEAAAGTFPTVQDSDNDGAWDGFEVRTGTNPRIKDTDGDGLGDWDEFTYSTDPLRQDTDGDNVTDTQELFTYGTRPKDVDSDRDCLWDGDEIFVYGTYPNLVDSDGDFFADLIEINQGYNPLDSGNHPEEEVVAGTGC